MDSIKNADDDEFIQNQANYFGQKLISQILENEKINLKQIVQNKTIESIFALFNFDKQKTLFCLFSDQMNSEKQIALYQDLNREFLEENYQKFKHYQNINLFEKIIQECFINYE